MSRILLCFPKNGASSRNVSVFLPLSLLSVASPLVDEYDVDIFDERIDPYERYIELLDGNPLVVGVSSLTGLQIRHGIELSAEAKRRGIPVVWGGVHPSILPEQTLDNPVVDYVIAGEGERAFLSLVKKIAKGERPQNGVIIEPIERLEVLPDLPYRLVNIEEYIKTIKMPGHRMLPFQFSRGCPYRCGYCTSGHLTKKWRALPVETALERLNGLISSLRLTYIEFYDENITTRIDLFEKLASGIITGVKWMIQTRLNTVLKLNLEELLSSGLDTISSGIETGSPRILKLIRKGETVEEFIESNRKLADAGVKTKYSMMLGFPMEEISDIYATVDLTLKILEDNAYASFNPFYVFQPYPGTSLATQFNVKGRQTLEEWSTFGRHNMDTPFVGDNREIIDNISFSSKYVGRLFENMFPDDADIRILSGELLYKWRNKDFNSSDWGKLRTRHSEIIKRYFGDNAY